MNGIGKTIMLAFMSGMLSCACGADRISSPIPIIPLKKVVFYEGLFRGGIQAIAEGEFDSRPGKEVVIVGQQDGVVLDGATGRLIRAFRLALSSRHLSVVNVGQTNFVVVARGGGYNEAGLMDSNGRCLWTYRPSERLPQNAMIWGDMDHKGTLDFFVADRDGLHRLNQEGKELWRVGGEVEGVQVYDPGGNSTPLIITKSPRPWPYLLPGAFEFRTKDGTLERKMRPRGNDITCFRVCYWNGAGHITTTDGLRLYVLTFGGQIVAEYSPGKSIYDIEVATVKLFGQEDAFLAVVLRFSSTLGQSEFVVFGRNGQVVYDEALGNSVGICAVQSVSDEDQCLIVGGSVTSVYRYSEREGGR